MVFYFIFHYKVKSIAYLSTDLHTHNHRIEVIYNENVPEFGPVLPAPALIYSAHDLRAFLSTKRKFIPETKFCMYNLVITGYIFSSH